MTQRQVFALSDGERSSMLWGRLAEHLERRINELHIEGEKRLPPDETEYKRGQIRAFRELLALDKDPPSGE